MDTLLQKMDLKKLTRKRIPFLVELPVHSASAPFLVSGTKKWLWVERVAGGFVKAAVRPERVPAKLSEQVVKEVAQAGRDRKWGNNFPLTEAGLKEAIEYLRYYGLEKLEILVAEKTKLPRIPEGVTVCPVAWVSKGRAVVVPEDRSYLGLFGTIQDTHWTAIVHNPSRGMAVLGDW